MSLGEALWVAGALFALLVGIVAYLWRRMDARIDDLAKAVQSSTQAVLGEKVRRLEDDYHLLHEWKRLMLPVELDNRGRNTYELIKRIEAGIDTRLDRLERKVLNGNP